MEMTGEYAIPASREQVWKMLNDPDVLKACIPGCEELEQTAEDAFAAKVTLKMGPVKAKFTGEVELQDKVVPESYSIVGEGKGGVAGFAKGGADVTLTATEEGTLLSYEANAQVGGKIAQLGSRLIDSTSKKLADKFFSNFSQMANEQASEADTET